MFYRETEMTVVPAIARLSSISPAPEASDVIAASVAEVPARIRRSVTTGHQSSATMRSAHHKCAATGALVNDSTETGNIVRGCHHFGGESSSRNQVPRACHGCAVDAPTVALSCHLVAESWWQFRSAETELEA